MVSQALLGVPDLGAAVLVGRLLANLKDLTWPLLRLVLLEGRLLLVSCETERGLKGEGGY